MNRITEFVTLWMQYAPKESDKLITGNDALMDYLKTGGFFIAPASTKYHGAFPGGLYEHSRCVFLRLKEMTEKMDLQWQRPESPFIVGMFHDLCKCDQYRITQDVQDLMNKYKDTGVNINPVYEYNPNTLLKGHGTKSVMILSQFINLTGEEMLCIRYHMGAYETDDWDGFDLAIKKYPNVLITHTADMFASKVDDT